MKLWEKGIDTDKKIEAFTVGNDRDYDLLLAPYDLRASRVHARMLARVGLITNAEAEQLCKGLDKIAAEVEKGNFKIGTAFEDVHSQIEYLLTEDLGEVGKKIHTARSRNDQVLVAMQLYFKDEIKELVELTQRLFSLLLTLAQNHKDQLLPGYTHLQVAMPSSFGLWFSSYAELLVDDMEFLGAAYAVCDQNPLGSAAGYGSSFPIDREFTTRELGFKTMKYNVVAAQMGRGRVERSVALALNSLGGTLSRLAMDTCLYLSQNFNFLSFPDAYTTGSSIMPHKKNPDVFELIRAKSNKVQGAIQDLSLLTNNLPSGYHRDMQLSKEIIFPAIAEVKACLEILRFCMKDVQVNPDILSDSKYDYLFTVDALNELVSQGMPFRDAYKEIAEAVQSGRFRPEKSGAHTHAGSLGNLCLDEIRQKMKLTNKRIGLNSPGNEG